MPNKFHPLVKRWHIYHMRETFSGMVYDFRPDTPPEAVDRTILQSIEVKYLPHGEIGQQIAADFLKLLNEQDMWRPVDNAAKSAEVWKGKDGIVRPIPDDAIMPARDEQANVPIPENDSNQPPETTSNPPPPTTAKEETANYPEEKPNDSE